MKGSSASTRGNKTAQTINYKTRNSNKFIPIVENKIKEKSDINITTSINNEHSNHNSFKDLHNRNRERSNTNGDQQQQQPIKNIRKTLMENTAKNAANKIKIFNRKISPKDKQETNPMYGSVKKVETKTIVRSSVFKPGASPKTSKTTPDKKNIRLNPNYYTASFFQDISSTKKEIMETSTSEKNTKSSSNLFRDNSLKSKKLIEEPHLFTNNFMEICNNIKTIIDRTKEELNTKEKENKEFSFFTSIEKLNGDIEDLYKKTKEREQISSAFEEKFESTKFNINLIKSSSERRDSIYKKFLNICRENMTEINDIIKQVYIEKPQPKKESLYIEQNITTNIINNHTHNSSNNVNVNVNLNLNTINNVSNISHLERCNNLHRVSKMMSRKKFSKKQFYNYMKNNNEDDILDLSQSMMSEGVIVKMPFKLYQVKKPKDDLMNLRILTDGNFIDSDDSDLYFGSDDSELFDMMDDHNDTMRYKNDQKKRNPFVKTRSKSLLDLRSRKNDIIMPKNDEKIKKAQKNMIRLFNDVSISKV